MLYKIVLSVVLATITQCKVYIFCIGGWYLNLINVGQRHTQGSKILP